MKLARLLSRLNIALGVTMLPMGGVQSAWGFVMAIFGAVMWMVTR